MKLSTLSVLTALALSTSSVNALTLYQDPVTGQVFTKGGEGRIEMGDFVRSTEVYTEREAKQSSLETETSGPKGNGITIINQKSPDFPLGKETHINMKFVPEDAPDMWLKAGVRIQGSFENIDTDYKNKKYILSGNPSDYKADTNFNDGYLRRVRFEIAAGFGEHSSFVMDVRNDKSTFGIDGDESGFNVGDAYVKIKKPFDTSLVNFKLYRAKIDVSRTETVKSARTIMYDRPYVADAAAQYISLNRRASNVQMYGDWNKKVHYQIAAGDASNPSKIKDATDKTASKVNSFNIEDQSFFYGGKVRFSPFDGWEETQRTETYFGEGQHFSLGASYWAIPTMKGSASDGTNPTARFDLDRKLINLEASGHYKGLFLQGEYFKFKDAVREWTPSSGQIQTGDSSGWYVTGEYVMPELHYIAPFFRYESWDRFDNEDGYDITSKVGGINWYLRGNTIKVGMLYQEDELEENTGDADIRKIRLTSQWFF